MGVTAIGGGQQGGEATAGNRLAVADFLAARVVAAVVDTGVVEHAEWAGGSGFFAAGAECLNLQQFEHTRSSAQGLLFIQDFTLHLAI